MSRDPVRIIVAICSNIFGMLFGSIAGVAYIFNQTDSHLDVNGIDVLIAWTIAFALWLPTGIVSLLVLKSKPPHRFDHVNSRNTTQP